MELKIRNFAVYCLFAFCAFGSLPCFGAEAQTRLEIRITKIGAPRTMREHRSINLKVRLQGKHTDEQICTFSFRSGCFFAWFVEDLSFSDVTAGQVLNTNKSYELTDEDFDPALRTPIEFSLGYDRRGFHLFPRFVIFRHTIDASDIRTGKPQRLTLEGQDGTFVELELTRLY